MWSLATDERMQKHGTPEIENADLSSLVLDMAQWGIEDAQKLTWVTHPPKGHLAQANELLHQLEALESNKITAHGKQLHQLSTHPRIAHMLINAKEQNLLSLATDIAPLLEEKDPLPPETGIDINLRIEALRRYRKEKTGSKRFAQIEKSANQYRKLFNIEADNSIVNDFDTGVLLTYAYPERIGYARPGNNAQFQLANGKIAAAGHKDNLAYEEWLAIAHVNDRIGMGKIFMASPLNPKDLAPLVKTKEIVTWNTKQGGLIASKDLRIGSIVLQSIPIQNLDRERVNNAICDAVKKEGEFLLNWNDEVTQWQNRILSLKKWYPKEKCPNVSTENLLLTNKEWLIPYLNGVKTTEDLKKINLKEVLKYSIENELQKQLEILAPEKIKVPSGSQIKLEYQADGSTPLLKVRLQECFGLMSTPTVNKGEINVLMHLLSPGYKLVQITSDLKSFWTNAYFDVRKDLRIRYKKHFWPENPLEA